MLLFNKGKSSIMFTDGGETKFLAPMQQMVVKDEDEARKIIKFYSFVEESSERHVIKMFGLDFEQLFDDYIGGI